MKRRSEGTKLFNTFVLWWNDSPHKGLNQESYLINLKKIEQ